MWFYNVCVLLNSPNVSIDVLQALSVLNKIISNDNVESQGYIFDEKDIEIDISSTNKSVQNWATYKLSLFKLLGDAILAKALSKITHTKDSSNAYYNPEFFNLVLNKYFAYLPLWTSVMHPGRQSNSNVETWFNIVKHNIKKDKRYMRATHFIRSEKEAIKGICNKILSGACDRKKFTLQDQQLQSLPKKAVSVSQTADSEEFSYQKTSICLEPSDLKHQESWQDKHLKFKKATHFDGNFAKKVKKMTESENMNLLREQNKIENKDCCSDESLLDLSKTIYEKPSYEHFHNGVIKNTDYYKQIRTRMCVLEIRTRKTASF